MKADHIRL